MYNVLLPLISSFAHIISQSLPGWSSSTSSLMKFLLIARSTSPHLAGLYGPFCTVYIHQRRLLNLLCLDLAKSLCLLQCQVLSYLECYVPDVGFFIDLKLMFNILRGALHFDLDLFIRMCVDWCDGFWKSSITHGWSHSLTLHSSGIHRSVICTWLLTML